MALLTNLFPDALVFWKMMEVVCVTDVMSSGVQ